MKTNISILSFGSLSAILVMLFVGCSTTKKVDWNSRVGNYTYDQVVEELGPPDKETTLSDGKKVADWISRRSSGGTSFGLGGGSFGRSGGVGMGVGVGSGHSDRVLRLTFGPDKKLLSWSKNY